MFPIYRLVRDAAREFAGCTGIPGRQLDTLPLSRYFDRTASVLMDTHHQYLLHKHFLTVPHPCLALPLSNCTKRARHVTTHVI